MRLNDLPRRVIRQSAPNRKVKVRKRIQDQFLSARIRLKTRLMKELRAERKKRIYAYWAKFVVLA